MSCATWCKGTVHLSIDWVEIAFVLDVFHWLKPWITNEGEEEIGVPGENPWWWASEFLGQIVASDDYGYPCQIPYRVLKTARQSEATISSFVDAFFIHN